MEKPYQMTIEIYLKLRDSGRTLEDIQKEYALSEGTVWTFEVGYQCYLQKIPLHDCAAYIQSRGSLMKPATTVMDIAKFREKMQ